MSFDETSKFSPRANQCKYLMDSKVGNFDEHKLHARQVGESIFIAQALKVEQYSLKLKNI